MGNKLVAATACLVASLACVEASANTSASSSLSMLEIQLFDLDPADGITPGVSFTTTRGTTASSVVSYGPSFYLYQMNNGAGSFGTVEANAAPPNGAVRASASISGKFYAVAIATLDGIEQDADQLVRSLKFNDGRHDDLKHAPADTRLL